MTDRSTEDLVQQLVRDLAPVKPIARLRVAAIGVVGLWVAAAVAMDRMTGARSRLGEAAFWSDPIAVAILIGLAVCASSAVVAALADAVPGRESLARAGHIGAGASAVWLLGCGLAAVARGEAQPAAGLWAGSASCLAHALVLAIPAALAAGFYVSRGAPRHRWVAAGVAAAGAAGLGALAVHASCGVAGGFHLLLGHCLTPVIGGLGLALPLAGLIRLRVGSGCAEFRSAHR